MQEKTCFFYFIHSFLQNTHMSLSILHIYSIKYSKPSHHQQSIPSLYHQLTQPPSLSQPHHQPTHQNPSHHQPDQYPHIKIIKTHLSKSSKPSHHQPNQYLATINDQYPGLHHQPTYQNPSHHQPDQYPRIKIIKPINQNHRRTETMKTLIK